MSHPMIAHLELAFWHVDQVAEVEEHVGGALHRADQAPVVLQHLHLRAGQTGMQSARHMRLLGQGRSLPSLQRRRSSTISATAETLQRWVRVSTETGCRLFGSGWSPTHEPAGPVGGGRCRAIPTTRRANPRHELSFGCCHRLHAPGPAAACPRPWRQARRRRRGGPLSVCCAPLTSAARRPLPDATCPPAAARWHSVIRARNHT